MKKPSKIILQHKPILDKADANAIKKVVESGWISEGPETKKFEENFRKFIGTKYAISTTSGTAAIFLALLSLGIKKNDEIIVPNTTFVATATAVKLSGGKPVLTEINENDFTISLESIRKKITKKTKAVIPVHLNGRCTQLDELKEICEKYNLRILEDASQALGSKYKKNHLGSICDAGAFSLSPPKIITTGQGGIVTTNNFEIYDKIRKLKDQGRDDKSDNHPIIGYNFKFTDIQAALGNSQFAKLQTRLKKMKKIHNYYSEKLGNCKSIILPKTRKEAQLWYFDILVKKRKKLIEFLLKSNIQTRAFYKPISYHPPFRTREKFSISNKISSMGLFLPSSSDLSYSQVDLISEKIFASFKLS